VGLFLWMEIMFISPRNPLRIMGLLPILELFKMLIFIIGAK